MNKIMIFIGTLQSGGAERVVSEISTMYADYFQEVVILTYYNAPIFYKIDKRIRIECIEKITRTTNKIKNAYWLRKFVKKEKPKVFLSFLISFNMMAIVSLAFMKVNLVVCERQDPSRVKTVTMRVIRNFLYHFCSRIEVQTLNGKNYFSSILQKKIYVIPNPTHITIEEREQALTTLKEKRIVMVGRLTPVKNHKMVIDAFSKVYLVHPEYRLDIYGDGELYKSLLCYIERLGLKSVVTLCGRTDNIISAISSARIFVLSSNVEGMSNALIEAMSLGISCISTDVSGVREIIDDTENGFIIPVGDESSLVDRLLRLMCSDDLQNKFSIGTNIVLRKFNKEEVLRYWLAVVTF